MATMKMEAKGVSLTIFDVSVEVYGEGKSYIVCSVINIDSSDDGRRAVQIYIFQRIWNSCVMFL